MAVRPVFVPDHRRQGLVSTVSVAFEWVSGLSLAQKRKRIRSLHDAAAAMGLRPLLEVSSKSEDPMGVRLSAFNLRIPAPDGEMISLEAAFQGSKVFEAGGPYTDLYRARPKDAKKDPRIAESGRLLRFQFGPVEVPASTGTLFYDWLYIRGAAADAAACEHLERYAGFTDIEFNPQKSWACQARSCAMLVSLRRLGALERAVESPEALAEILAERPGPRYYQPSLDVL